MNTTLTLVDLGGAIALLIWGVHMVQTGITRAFGPQLRRMLSYALGNRFKAFLAGVGVTSILQSSTATGLMVTAFAAGGLVDLVPALAMTLWGQRWTQHQRILRGEYHLKTAAGYSKPVPIRAAMRSVEGSSARYCCGNLSLRPMRVPAHTSR
jgi:hypothetical protein